MFDRIVESPHTSDLPPLRILMGSAIAFAGGAAWHQAGAQSTESPVELAPISIEGGDAGTSYRTPVPQLPKLSQPLLDTPQSVNVVPRQVIDDQGITATRDALRTVPGISLAAGEAGAQGDNLTLRGFTARNDFYLDGMRDFGSYLSRPIQSAGDRGVERAGVGAVRPRLDGRCDQSGQQAAATGADHRRQRRVRHRRDEAFHRSI